MTLVDDALVFAELGVSSIEFDQKYAVIENILITRRNKLDSDQIALLTHYLEDSKSKNRVTMLEKFRHRLQRGDPTSQEAAILNWNIDALQRNIEPWSYHEKILAEFTWKAVMEAASEKDKEQVKAEIKSRIDQLKTDHFKETLQTVTERIEQRDPFIDDILKIQIEGNNWKVAHEKMSIKDDGCHWLKPVGIIIGALFGFAILSHVAYRLYRGESVATVPQFLRFK